jgi:hypothetical protein
MNTLTPSALALPVLASAAQVLMNCIPDIPSAT